MSHWDPFTLLLLALVGIFAAIWYAWFCFNKNHGSDIPPGPPGLPLIGNLLSLDPELHKYFTSLSQTYGPIFSLRLGTKYGIVVSSPSMIRQVLEDHDVIFANRDVPVAGRVAFYDGSDILWNPHGSEWRMLRKVSTQWIMQSNTTLDYSICTLRRKEVRKTVGYLYSQVGSPLDLGEQMFLTVLNVITNMMWGGTMEGDERVEVGAEFRDVLARTTELLGKPNLSDFFPYLALFDLQGVEKQMRLLVLQLDQIFEKMIKKRLKKKKKNKEINEGDKDDKESKDFLLKLQDGQNSKTPLTITHVKAVLMGYRRIC